MARTFIHQPTQIFRSHQFDDNVAAGSALQTNSTTIESDLNALRSQVRRLLWAGVSGSWYDAITAPSGTNSARGLNTINTDLTDLEQKRFLFRRQALNVVNIATGSNFALLSSSLGTAPASFAVTSHPNLSLSFATGSIVALLSGAEGAYGSHSLAQTSGSSVLSPKNLVIVRDAWSGAHLTASNGKDVYGLLQAESAVVTGDAFNDTNRRTQISFVYEQVTNQTSSLAAASSTLVGGRSIMYSYVRRTALDDIPEDAYLSDSIFVDRVESSGGGSSGNANLTDITLDRAIDNQAGTVTQTQNIAIQIAAGFNWTFLSGTKELWQIASSDSTDLMTVNVDRISFSSSFVSTFNQGISVATGSSQVNVGVIAGAVNTLSGTTLLLSGGSQLQFTDFYGAASNYSGGKIPLATTTAEWNNFVAGFGNTQTILGAFTTLSQSISSSVGERVRYNAGVTADVSADTNITFPTNLDAALGSYVAKDFRKDVEIYYNGILLLPGSSSFSSNDVYPGNSHASGDLKFPYTVRSGSLISMVIYT